MLQRPEHICNYAQGHVRCLPEPYLPSRSHSSSRLGSVRGFNGIEGLACCSGQDAPTCPQIGQRIVRISSSSFFMSNPDGSRTASSGTPFREPYWSSVNVPYRTLRCDRCEMTGFLGLGPQTKTPVLQRSPLHFLPHLRLSLTNMLISKGADVDGYLDSPVHHPIRRRSYAELTHSGSLLRSARGYSRRKVPPKYVRRVSRRAAHVIGTVTISMWWSSSLEPTTFPSHVRKTRAHLEVILKRKALFLEEPGEETLANRH